MNNRQWRVKVQEWNWQSTAEQQPCNQLARPRNWLLTMGMKNWWCLAGWWDSFKFLDVQIPADLTWVQHIDAITKKAPQCLYFIRIFKEIWQVSKYSIKLLLLLWWLYWQFASWPGEELWTCKNKGSDGHCLDHLGYWLRHHQMDLQEMLPQAGSKYHQKPTQPTFWWYRQEEDTGTWEVLYPASRTASFHQASGSWTILLNSIHNPSSATSTYFVFVHYWITNHLLHIYCCCDSKVAKIVPVCLFISSALTLLSEVSWLLFQPRHTDTSNCPLLFPFTWPTMMHNQSHVGLELAISTYTN